MLTISSIKVKPLLIKMNKISAEKEKLYLDHFDGWALPIIKDVVKKYQWLYQSRFDEDELINAAFVFYRERRKKLIRINEGMLRHIARAYIYTYVVVNDTAITIPGGTLTKKGGMEKVKEILAPLRNEELFYKESEMAKNLKIDYETLINALPSCDRIVLVSMLLGHHRKFTTELLKGIGIRNPREVMKKAVSRIIKGFSDRGYL